MGPGNSGNRLGRPPCLAQGQKWTATGQFSLSFELSGGTRPPGPCCIALPKVRLLLRAGQGALDAVTAAQQAFLSSFAIGLDTQPPLPVNVTPRHRHAGRVPGWHPQLLSPLVWAPVPGRLVALLPSAYTTPPSTRVRHQQRRSSVGSSGSAFLSTRLGHSLSQFMESGSGFFTKPRARRFSVTNPTSDVFHCTELDEDTAEEVRSAVERPRRRSIFPMIRVGRPRERGAVGQSLVGAT